MEEIEINPDDFLWFKTEAEAIDAEAFISEKMKLPSPKGKRWDEPKQRLFNGELKWSVIRNHDIEIEGNTLNSGTWDTIKGWFK